jgi:mannose-6-phosphate isomerase-like protein (cupin superfamily)
MFEPVIVRAAEAEALGSTGHRLLADATATGGALSTHRVRLARGADGAVPHRHKGSSELFFVVEGELDVLVGTEVVTAGSGDLLVVPPGLAHAFGAHQGSTADALIVITPGVERFEYFRQVVRVREGLEPRESLLAVQEQYDTYFLPDSADSADSAASAARAAWDAVRAPRLRA